MALTAQQQRVLGAFTRQARRLGAGPKVTKALIEAGLVEANLGNPRYGDRDSLGSLQQRASWGPAAERLDPGAAAAKFIRAAKPIAGKYGSAGELAQAVQRSAFPTRYQQRSRQADALLGPTPRLRGQSVAQAASSTRTIPGTDLSAQRGALIAQFVTSKNADPVNFALGIKQLQDTPARTIVTKSTKTAGRPPASSGGLPDGGLARTLVARAKTIDAKHLPYQWGGGHAGRVNVHDAQPLDCSGAVSAVLGINPRVSGEFKSWGKPGEGGDVTVYSNAKHVLMAIRGKDGQMHMFGTSATNPGGGAGWIPRSAIPAGYLRGFTARHM